ncbi:MAG: TonB-dependent receptor [Mangrovibacterium sp.]
MKKKRNKRNGHLWDDLSKTYRIMKLTCLFMLVMLVQVSASSYSQNTRLSLTGQNLTIEQILERIEDQTQFSFFYNLNEVDLSKVVNVSIKDRTIEEVLDQVMEGTGLAYTINNKLIIIHKGKEAQSFNFSFQQQKGVSGKVTNEQGEPIPGVTVLVKGTNNGTITNADGNFTFSNVPADAVFVFSFVGMKTREVPVAGQEQVNVSLQEETIGIGEVVAVGYGVQRKVNVTGALSTVEGDKIIAKPVTQLSAALQGMAPGVTIVQNSGQPGVDIGTIRIRGIGTLNNNDPLVLVDGMEYSINNIDANDIESISVLKDAAASAIYGVRAANGVILITTKRGKTKELNVTYDGYVGIQDPTRLPDFVGAQQYMKLVNLLSTNSGGSAMFTDADIAAYDDPGRNTDLYPDVFWMDEILQGTGLQQQHSVAVSGGNDKSKYRFSTNYLKQDGLVKKANFERLTVRLNSDVIFNDRLNFNADVSAKFSTRTEPQGIAGGIWFQFGQAIMSNPTLPVKYSDGTWGIGRSDGNPVRLQEEGGKYKYEDNLVSGNFKLSYEVLDGLKITGTAMINYTTSFNSLYNQALTYVDFFSKQETVKGANEITKQNYKTLHSNLQGLLTYDKILGDHSFSVLAGVSRVEEETDYLTAYRNGGSLDVLDELAGGDPSSQTNNGYSYGYGLLSYFGRLNYSYMDKYLFEANIRNDGSSRFADNNRWGVFPSFSAGWRLSQEQFMKQFQFLDELKLRASWGKLGNQEIGNYPYQAVMGLGYNYPFGGALNSGARMSSAANAEISWETTQMSNIGLDAMILKGKLNFSFEYYVKKTDDILLQLPIPLTVGQNAPYQNAGSVENKGWELTIGHRGNPSKDFKYEVQFNLSDVKNKITDLKDTDWEEQDNDNRILAYHVGEPIAAFYGYEAEGIFLSPSEIEAHATQPGNIAPGDLKYKNQNTDENINASDRTIIGSNIPRYTFGLNLSASYKNFDFLAFFQGVGKVDVNTVQSNKAPISGDGNFKTIHTDSWTSNNQDASFPRLTTYTHNYVSSSFWIKSGAYMRLKNAQIGYTLPKSLTNSIGIDKCRFYLGGQNLFTWSKLNDDGIDPENPQDSRYYPQVKIYTIGVNVDF